MKKCVVFSLVAVSLGASARAADVGGVVSVWTTPVRYASVTFVDKSDTTKTYSALTDTAGKYQVGILTSVKPAGNLPASFALEQNYPNPFVSSTTISYTLNTPSTVQVTIYDILGRVVKTFTIGAQAAGAHGILWSGTNNFGERAANGAYFYRLQAGEESQVRKMVLGNGSGNVAVPLPGISRSRTPTATEGLDALVQGGTFSVRIANTDSTFPVITPLQLDNVEVQNDTTLDFAVTIKDGATIFLDSTRQIIRGFGGQNMPGWAGVGDLTPAQVQTAFGTGPGSIGMTVLRIRVPYDSTKFTLEVPTVQLAKSLGALVIASPWSPPPWMKSNNNIVGGTLPDTSYPAFAAHMKSFVDYMASNNASLYAISLQNEPDVRVSYESCDWTATQLLDFVKSYAPIIGAKIIIPESYKFDHAMSDPILNDPAASANVSIIGGHLYAENIQKYYPLALSKGKEVWMTEHIVSCDAWPWAFDVAIEINDCMNAGMSAYLLWYIRRSYGPIDESGNISKGGYFMSQYARFVRPGYYRVSATATPQVNISVTAYKHGSTVVIVASNTGSASVNQTFILQNGTATSFTPYVTSGSVNCSQGPDITVSNGAFQATLSPSSVTTFVSE
jgi:glucuronoarabinoxylan endo-1,4-beta-xylanase